MHNTEFMNIRWICTTLGSLAFTSTVAWLRFVLSGNEYILLCTLHEPVPWKLQHSLPTISAFTVVAGCCYCYQKAQASFLLWQFWGPGSFGKCCGLRERSYTSGSLPQSNKEQKRLNKLFSAFAVFPLNSSCVISKRQAASPREVSGAERHFQQLFIFEQHIILFSILGWSACFLSGQRKFRFLRELQTHRILH